MPILTEAVAEINGEYQRDFQYLYSQQFLYDKVCLFSW